MKSRKNQKIWRNKRIINVNFLSQEVSNSKQSEEKDAEQRYQTTVSALEATGLLDITLKTSELVQRNEAFQKDLEMFEKVVRATYRDFTGGKDF